MRLVRVIARHLLILAVVAGCTSGPKPKTYLPANYMQDSRWRKTYDRLILLGRIGNSMAEDGYWKLGFVQHQKSNAWAIRWGEVFVTDALIDGSEDLRDAVLAHEVAHHVTGHIRTKETISSTITMITFVAGIFIPFLNYADILLNPVFVSSYGRPAEMEADRIAAWILIRAFGKKDGKRKLSELRKFLTRLPQEDVHILSSHPHPEDRIKQIEGIFSGRIHPQKPPPPIYTPAKRPPLPPSEEEKDGHMEGTD